MNKSLLHLMILCTLLVHTVLLAQDTPQLVQVKFLVDGQSVDRTSYGDVTVELKFDVDMDSTKNPSVIFGLVEPFDLTLPEGNGWISRRLWQGFFTVSDNNPETGDGEYDFRIVDGLSADSVKMDTTLSSELGSTLFICRSGELTVNKTNIAFDKVNVGSAKSETFVVRNTSCADLLITGISVSAPFYIVNETEFTLADNQSREINVQFAPTTRMWYTKNLTIRSNDPDNEVTIIELTGGGIGSQISVWPAELNFGKVEVGEDSTQTVFVYNVAPEAPVLADTLIVNSITSNSNVFLPSVETLTVAPGDTEIVQVTFRPNDDIVYSNYVLTLRSNDLQKPARSVLLSGNAADEKPPLPPTAIRVNWDGYGGFVSSNSLRLCWANPSDPNGIRALWYYFTSSPLPLTAAPDTAKTENSVGGREQIALNDTCASLLLYNRVRSGFWYCYVWLEDGRGNQDWSSAVRTTFTYDISAPGAPILQARSIPGNLWFGYGQVFSLTFTIPYDVSRGIRDASEIRWRYKGRPMSAGNYASRYLLGDDNRNEVTVNIPFNDPDLCGADSLFVWLADSAGNVSKDSVAAFPYRFDVCSPEIVRVLPDQDNIAEIGHLLVDTLEITDHSGVDTAWVRYRFGGAEAQEPPKPAVRIDSTNKFLVQIPAAGITRRGVEVQAYAIDMVGNQTVAPGEYCSSGDDGESSEEGGWFPFRTRISGSGDYRIDRDGQAVPLLAGGDSTNYQLFSVPYVLDTSSVISVFEDDLGIYDNTKWRVFDYLTSEQRFLEGQEVRPFIPGRSYFVITNQDDIIVDSGSGVTRRTVCNDTLELNQGWNLIAAPFNFPVHKESLSLLGATSSVTLRSFERGWNITNVMEPWKGYALYVPDSDDNSNDDNPVYLVIKPKAAEDRLAKGEDSYWTLQQNEWMVQIGARAGLSYDNDNWAGVYGTAEDGFDSVELAEPPVLCSYVKVSFPHADWNQIAEEFSTDIRSSETQEQVWEFDVTTNQRNQEVDLSFGFLGEIPFADVFLVDKVAAVVQNLAANPVYTFKSGDSGARRSFKLIAGPPEFASANADGLGIVPKEFALMQNFPNPFNPETTIRYNLPEAGEIKLQIFDLLGRQVTTLVNEKQNAGYYSVLWNGRDNNGRQVASGVYIYRVLTGEQSMARKMILMK